MLRTSVALAVGLLANSAGGQSVCAPLEGTAGYSQCINDQLTGRQSETYRDLLPPETVPGPVPPADYLEPDGVLVFPDPKSTLEERGALELQQSIRNSDTRSNLLRQQIQNDLRQGVHGPPPLPGSGAGSRFLTE